MNISEYIERDLAARIQCGEGLPERLTLSGIAEMYDVSLTPVRAALDGLFERKLMAKQPNGRLQVAKGRSRAARPRPALVDWDAKIGREVIIVSLVENGDAFLREEAMAEEHGIGRAQLRSVFQRLAGGGILEHVPRRGWRVPRFDQAEMDAYLDVRETLEVKALDLARPHLDPDRLAEMRAGNGSAAIASGEIDNTLHAYFVELSGNRYIDAFFASNGRYYNALFDYAALGARVLAEMASQHTEILDHACARRWAKSRAALRHHIQSQRPVMEAMIDIVRGTQP